MRVYLYIARRIILKDKKISLEILFVYNNVFARKLNVKSMLDLSDLCISR